jgi:RNA polymerase sigma factor (sigma-70 family)
VRGSPTCGAQRQLISWCDGRPFLAELVGRALAGGTTHAGSADAIVSSAIGDASPSDRKLIATLLAADGWVPIGTIAALLEETPTRASRASNTWAWFDAEVRTYLFGIARNELYAHWRRAKKNDELDVGATSIVDLGPTPSTLYVKRREERVLLEAVRSIPLELQLALELYYWEQLSGPELAEVLGVPEGTARSRVRRALEALREALVRFEAADLGSTVDDLDGWAESLGRLKIAVDGAA